MCKMELATKTMTADSRIGSQREARGTMRNLLKGCEDRCGIRRRGYAREETRVKRASHRLDVDGCPGVGGRLVVCLCGFLFVFGEFFFVPGVVAEGSVGDAARVDHDLLGTG